MPEDADDSIHDVSNPIYVGHGTRHSETKGNSGWKAEVLKLLEVICGVSHKEGDPEEIGEKENE